jgi:hypothetical protein
MRSLFIAFALLAGCAATPHRECHKSTHADGVGPDGELHYPEVCSTATTPASPTVAQAPARKAAPAPVATGPLAALRPDAPEPCREYAHDKCSRGEACDEAVRAANALTTKKRAYAQCMKLLAGN